MIIVEVLTLIASIGTCVIAFLVWKNHLDALKSASDNQQSSPKESDQPDKKQSVLSGIGTSVSALLSRAKNTKEKDSESADQQMTSKESDQPSTIHTNISTSDSTKDSSYVTKKDESNVIAGMQNEIAHNSNNSEYQTISTSKDFDGFNRDFKVDDSKNKCFRSLDKSIATNSFTSMKTGFLVGAVILIALTIISGFLNYWIILGISVLVASYCVARFVMKQTEYNKNKAIKKDAIDEYDRISEKVKQLNDNKGLSEEEKNTILERWINACSERVDEKQTFGKKEAMKAGIIAGIICLLIVGIGSLLPGIIPVITDSLSKDTPKELNAVSESSFIEETITETTLLPTSTPTVAPTSTSTPTPTPSAVIVSNPVDIGYLVTNISSSSIDNESSGNNYFPYQIMDGDLDTSWAEGLDDNGIGEYIIFNIPKGTLISGLVVYTGYCKSSNVFYKNGAPSVLDVYSGTDGYRLYLNTYDTNFAADNYDVAIEGIYITFPSAIVSNGELKITIVDVRDGEAWDDTNISEIRILGTSDYDDVIYSTVGNISYSIGDDISELSNYDYEEITIDYIDYSYFEAALDGWWTTGGNQGGPTSAYYVFNVEEGYMERFIHNNADGSNTHDSYIDVNYEISDGMIKVVIVDSENGTYYLLDEYDCLQCHWDNNGYSGSSSLVRTEESQITYYE